MSENLRFMRTETLLGKDGVKKLRQSCVMMVGLGAVGGYALEAIARSGVGKLILVDFDVFEESNINRQILALTSTLGKKKTEAAAERVLQINPECNVITKELFVNQDSIAALFDEKVDFVVDAIDALNSKCCLMEELYKRQIPFISSMGAALKTDPSKIRFAALDKSKNCTLAKFIRKRMKRRGVDLHKIMCVFSEENSELCKTALIRTCDDDQSAGRQRNILGSMPTITAIFGLTIANEVILRLSGFK